MDSCDVLIVGGGPAGSSCAWGLRNTGLDVLVLDRQNFPRDKICAGWITPSVVTTLEIDPAHDARNNVLQPITAFRTGAIGGPTVLTEYGSTVSYGIRRREFDDYLLRRSGARLLPGTPLTDLRREGSFWIANDAIRARLVVGAGGHFCPVARRQLTNDFAVVAQEVEFPLHPANSRAAPSVLTHRNSTSLET